MKTTPIITRCVLKIDEHGWREEEDIIVREKALTIYVNSRELATIVCSPVDLEYMAVGFLCSEGILKRREDLRSIAIDEEQGIARLEIADPDGLTEKICLKRYIAPSCGRSGISVHFAGDAACDNPVASGIKVEATTLCRLVEELQERSRLFQRTGGVHNAALAQDGEILIFQEDIGRHNTIDKIFGQCFLEEIPRNDKMIIYSGRISSEILMKVARMGIPMLVSRSAPTGLALQLAENFHITVAGFVRGNRLTIYTHRERITY